MTNHTPCLLDEAATFMKVQYLSDLRFLSTDGRSRLPHFLRLLMPQNTHFFSGMMPLNT